MRSGIRRGPFSPSALGQPEVGACGRAAARRCVALLLLASMGLAGCSDDERPRRAPVPLAQDPVRLERVGEGLFRRYCALCHGRDGEGYAADNAPRLAGQEWLRSASDAFITAAIADGRPGTPMSAWSRSHGGPLTDVQISALLTYLRSWQRHPTALVDGIEVQGDVRRGYLQYVVKCAGCHGPRGEGVDAVALNNERFLATASDGFIQYAILHGREGTRMPAFRDLLEPEQLDDVVAFIRSLETSNGSLPGLPIGGHDRPPNAPALADMQLVINPDGEPASFELREERFVSSEQVRAALREGRRMVILDARATSDWLVQRIPGAIPVPFYELEGIVEELPRDGTPMVAYCGCPHAASGRVVDALRRQGFTNTAVLDEGIGFWAEQDYPVASGESQP